MILISNYIWFYKGAFLNQQLTHQKGYYGNGSCFLWKLLPSGKINVYPATGLNEYYILSEHGAEVCFGGGKGKFGLWLDDSLDNGHSEPCITYGNDQLSNKKDFKVLGVEVWCFSI